MQPSLAYNSIYKLEYLEAHRDLPVSASRVLELKACQNLRVPYVHESNFYLDTLGTEPKVCLLRYQKDSDLSMECCWTKHLCQCFWILLYLSKKYLKIDLAEAYPASVCFLFVTTIKLIQRKQRQINNKNEAKQTSKQEKA